MVAGESNVVKAGRWRRLATHPEVWQLLRYAVVSAVALAVDMAVLTLAVEAWAWHYLLAAALGFCVGLVVNFLLAEKWAFGQPRVGSAWLRFGSYAVIGLIGLGLLELLMWLQVDQLGWHYIVAKVIATAVGFVWNYFGRRLLYRPRLQSPVEVG
ncbi:MAG: GtrA family protein [Propionibacteriaceae bacterium]|jgi:putative flippase GtrA|nr:GtrA family protein [Propionibacteriaceae bacterium]